ncbi:hypothetical protein [Natrinema halophilum]|uniref:Uncharacterized protein n=1 Tax=Natrinema halophilum TaxID=1699371 RepID=A0A7D5GIH9_9EURY|nr:hypothetical protein [Natrinema halophilum]QLG49914.1 hypothetical protein HYG82_14145 [Natrinema halophilum]
MVRSDAGSDPLYRSGLRHLVGAVVLLVVGSSLVVYAPAAAPAATATGSLAILIGLAIAVATLRQGSPPAGDGGEDDTNSSVWNAIPSEQYDGRHAESGGLTRDEQERALEDIRQQADGLSDDPSRK